MALKMVRLALPEITLLPTDRVYHEYIGMSDEVGVALDELNERGMEWSLEKGLSYIDRLITKHSYSAVLHSCRSSYFLQKGDSEGALNSIKRSLEYLPNHLHIRLNLLKTYVQSNRISEVTKMIGRDPSIVKFSNNQTTFFASDFLEFYISASAYVSSNGDMQALGEVMEIAEKHLIDPNDFMFFQMSTRKDFDTAMKQWSIKKTHKLMC